MTIPKITCLLLLTILLLIDNSKLSAQELKWFNPIESNYPVIEGRGWQTDLANPYDRLPAKAEKTVRTAVWDLSKNTAGEYLNFKTSSKTIIIRYVVKGNLSLPHMPSTGVSGIDLYARDVNGIWQWAKGSFRFGDTCEYKFTNLALSAKEEEFRLYLPLYNTVSWLTIGVPANASFNAYELSNEQPIVLYGTSIMQGGCASRPGLAWANILGRKIDRPIINLGFSGNGQLEQPLIDLMNEQQAKLFVLDCMPNLSDKQKFADLPNRITNAISSLQSKHPQTPILLTEHCCGAAITNMDTAMINKYQWSSNMLSATYDSLIKNGVKNIYLLTTSAIGFDAESTVDGTHPNDIGMMKYAEAYEQIIRKIFNETKGPISTTNPIRQRRDFATYDFIQRHNAVLKTVQEVKPNIVLIGNSITHFWGGLPESGINRGKASWEKYLQPLNAANLGFGWDRIENVLWRVHHGELDKYTPKKIIINIGTNNLSIGDSDDQIIAGLKHLIEAIATRQPQSGIYLSGIYPRRGMEERIAILNKKIHLLAKSINHSFINPGTELLKADGKIDEQLFSDGLHPNEKGYEKLGFSLSTYLKK